MPPSAFSPARMFKTSPRSGIFNQLSYPIRGFVITLLLVSLWSCPSLEAQHGSALVCDCGYIDTLDPISNVWSAYWQSDFKEIRYQTLTQTFSIMRYAIRGAGPSQWSRRFDPENVAIDSAGLHLTVQPPVSNDSVPYAGIYTNRKDFHFGAYHFEAQTTDRPGTVTAFYVYGDDNNEVDIEYVSQNVNSPIVRFSVKPQEYLPNGQASGTTYQEARPTFDLSSDSHTYSILWYPSSILFAVDGNYSAAITHNVPQRLGVLALSHWSDGNPNYSGGPPSSPAVLHVSRAWALYNVSNVTLACQAMNTPCKAGAAGLLPPSYSPPSSGRSHSRMRCMPSMHLSAVVVSISVFLIRVLPW